MSVDARQQGAQAHEQQAPPTSITDFTNTAEFFLSNYRLGKTLGIGSFGKVCAARNYQKVAEKTNSRGELPARLIYCLPQQHGRAQLVVCYGSKDSRLKPYTRR